MTTETLTTHFERMEPLKLDTLIAVGLMLLAWAQILLTSLVLPVLTKPEWVERVLRTGPTPGAGARMWIPFIIAAAVFLPLIIRREIPWLSLLLSGGFALFYELQLFPPSIVILGPMIAAYSLGAYAKQRRTTLIALAVAGLVVTAVVFGLGPRGRQVTETTSAFVMIAATALLGDTVRNRREYAAEVEQRAIAAEQAREEETLRRLDEERIDIAREVHDIVAHSLSIVAVQASAAETLLESNPDQARESLTNIRATSTKALSELRSMLDVLRTGTETNLPMSPSADLTHLDELVAPVRESGLDISLNIEGDPASVPAFASVSAYRLVQESLTNIVRHSDAHAATVALRITADEVAIEVVDDGTGASSEAIASGHGIRGMSERVEALGGRFVAGPGPAGAGFRVSASIPLHGGVS